MSLINQMLKDLESRRTPEPPAGGVLPGSNGPAASGARRFLLPVMGLLVVGLAAALGFNLWQQPEAPKAPVTAVPQPAPAPAVAQAATPTTTVVKPQTVRVPVQPPKQARPLTQPATVSASHNGRLTRIVPSVIDGSWQARSFTLRGTELNKQQRILVSWGGKEKVLPADRVEWVDSTSARIKLVTGNNDEVWQVTLLHPDGSRGNSVEFEVIASPYLGRDDMHSTTPTRIEKTIRPPSNSEKADRLYQQGYQALQQQQADKAEQLWHHALSTEAQHPAAREGLVALYLSQGRKVEAAQLLEDGVKLQPENPTYAQLYARLLAEQGDSAGAIAALEPAMGVASKHPQLHALAAALYQQQRDYGKSINSYQRALRLQPQQATWWMGMGISLEGDGKAAEAKSAYEEAVRRGGLSGESLGYVRERLQQLK